MTQKKSSLPGLILILGIVMVIVGVSSMHSPEDDLVKHVVASDTSLAPKDGRRIEIHCNNPNLTKEDARKLIAHYDDRAGREGQVSIRKPDRDNNYLPWAVWNAGEHTKFYDKSFE